MSETLDFYYDFGSPNAYLAHKVLPEIAARHGATVRLMPMLLGGVFKETGNQSPMMAFAGITGKLDYMRQEIMRFIARHNLEFRMNPHFPINTISLMRGAVFARGKPWEAAYAEAVFHAMWVGARRMDQPDEFGDVLETAGLPAPEILSATQDGDVKAALIEATAAAVQRGVFGAPTVFAGDEMFFGKDSLNALDWHLGNRG